VHNNEFEIVFYFIFNFTRQFEAATQPINSLAFVHILHTPCVVQFAFVMHQLFLNFWIEGWCLISVASHYRECFSTMRT